jgi:hypothetical protein
MGHHGHLGMGGSVSIDGAPAAIRGISLRRVVLWVAVAAVGTFAAYLVFLPWNAQKQLGPDGYLHGPYGAGQVIGLVVTLLVIGWVTGWFSNWIAPWVIPPVLTLLWSIDAMNDVENDGLWPIGAFMVLVGATVATIFLVLAGVLFTHRRRDTV